MIVAWHEMPGIRAKAKPSRRVRYEVLSLAPILGLCEPLAKLQVWE
jgi:hypothetical protein